MSDDVHEPEGEKTDKKGKHHVLVGKLQQTAVKAQIKGQFRHTGKRKSRRAYFLRLEVWTKPSTRRKQKMGKEILPTGQSIRFWYRKNWFRSPRQKKAVGCKGTCRFQKNSSNMVCQHGDKGNPF